MEFNGDKKYGFWTCASVSEDANKWLAAMVYLH